MLSYWKSNAFYQYNNNSDEAAQRAFISEYFRTEYAIDYDEVQKDLEENQSVIDEFEELYRRQYEDLANDNKEILSENKSSQQMAAEEYAANYTAVMLEASQKIADAQAENSALLKSAWERAEHDFATGAIATESELWAQKSALLDQYGNADLEEHWRYYEELYGYQQDYAEESVRLAEKASKEQVAARQSEWENIDRLNNLGLLSDEDAAKARADFVKKYFGDADLTTGKGITDENYRYLQKVHDDNIDMTKQSLDEQSRIVDDGLSAIIKRYRQAYDDLEQKRKAYRDKLMAIGGDLFSVDVAEDGNGKKKTVYTVNNVDGQLRKMREYHASIKKLRAEGMSDGRHKARRDSRI